MSKIKFIAITEAAVDTPDKVLEVLTNVAAFLFTALLITAIIFILIAAFNFLTAQGDAEKVKSARNQILWAVVAIVIALISSGAAKLIKEFLP